MRIGWEVKDWVITPLGKKCRSADDFIMRIHDGHLEIACIILIFSDLCVSSVIYKKSKDSTWILETESIFLNPEIYSTLTTTSFG